MADRAFDPTEPSAARDAPLHVLVDTLTLGGIGCLAVTETGIVVAQSDAAAALLPANGPRRSFVQHLLRALSRRGWQGGADVFIWRHPDSTPLRVLYFPVGHDGPRLALAILEPVARIDAVRRDDFIARYGITAAEARVLDRLVAGQRPSEIARATGVGLATVKTQLRSLFARTETRGQAELVALFLRSG